MQNPTAIDLVAALEEVDLVVRSMDEINLLVVAEDEVHLAAGPGTRSTWSSWPQARLTSS